MTNEKLQITTLGGLTIRLNNTAVSNFASRKADALLVYLGQRSACVSFVLYGNGDFLYSAYQLHYGSAPAFRKLYNKACKDGCPNPSGK